MNKDYEHRERALNRTIAERIICEILPENPPRDITQIGCDVVKYHYELGGLLPPDDKVHTIIRCALNNSGATVGELEPMSKSAAEIHALYAYLAKKMEI